MADGVVNGEMAHVSVRVSGTAPRVRERKLNAGHFAFMRGLVQGLDERVMWARYMEHSEGEYRQTLAKRTIARLRNEFAAAARRERRHGQARLVLIDVSAIPMHAAPRPSLEDFARDSGWAAFSQREQIEAYEQAYPDAGAARRAMRRERLIDKQLKALRWLEQFAVQPPLAGDAMSCWFNPDWVQAFEGFGLFTLRQLVDRINSIPHRWWRALPTIGETKALDVEAWLLIHETSLRLPLRAEVYARHPAHRTLLSHVDVHGTSHAAGVPGSLLVLRKTDVVPLDRLLVPRELDGSLGRYRAHHDHCLIDARNDLEAILAWVKSRRGLTPQQKASKKSRGGDMPIDGVGYGSGDDHDTGGAGQWHWLSALSHTQRGYLREAERFLLWAIVQKRKALSDMNVQDCAEYRDFLADPRPADLWCGPRNARRGTPAWRPFEGPLSPRAQHQSVVVLRGLFSYLNRVNYLAGNAWHGVDLPLRFGAKINVGRSFTMGQWDFIEQRLAALPPRGSRDRLDFALTLLYRTGLRLSEAVNARVDDLTWEEYPPDRHDQAAVQGWWLNVVGKGDKPREVPLPEAVLEKLRVYFTARGLNSDLHHAGNQGAYLLGKVADLRERAPWAATARDAYDPKAGIGAAALYGQLKGFFRACAIALEETDEPAAKRFRAASTHWLRHTYASHRMARGATVETTRDNLGHASLATTTVYVTTEKKRRMKEVQAEAVG